MNYKGIFLAWLCSLCFIHNGMLDTKNKTPPEKKVRRKIENILTGVTWLTRSYQSWPEDVESSLKSQAGQLGQGVDEEGDVATDVVHEEEKCADTEGSDAGRNDLHQHSEHQGKPSLR